MSKIELKGTVYHQGLVLSNQVTNQGLDLFIEMLTSDTIQGKITHLMCLSNFDETNLQILDFESVRSYITANSQCSVIDSDSLELLVSQGKVSCLAKVRSSSVVWEPYNAAILVVGGDVTQNQVESYIPTGVERLLSIVKFPTSFLKASWDDFTMKWDFQVSSGVSSVETSD